MAKKVENLWYRMQSHLTIEAHGSVYLSIWIDQQGNGFISTAPAALTLPQQVWGRTVSYACIRSPHLHSTAKPDFNPR